MDTARNLPIIKNVDDVIAGGDWAAVYHALFLSRSRRRVILVLQETYLATDVCGPLRYRLEELPDTLKELVLPLEELHDGEKLHPDGFKRYLEKLCEEEGIDILYFTQLVDVTHIAEDGYKIARVGGKFGLGGIRCREVYKKEAYRQTTWSFRAFLTREGRDRLYYDILEAGDHKVEGAKERRLSWSPEHPEEVPVKPWSKWVEEQYSGKEALIREYAKIKADSENSDLALGRFAVIGLEEGGPEEQNKDESGKHSRFVKWDRYKEKSRKSSLLEKEVQVSVQSCNPLLKYGLYSCVEDCRPVNGSVWEYDLVVAGGGTSGAMAALHGAKCGLKTVLVEPGFSLGGTAVAGGVSTYWFGRRFRPVAEVDEAVGRIRDLLGLKGRKGIWSSSDDFHTGIRDYCLQTLLREAGVEVVLGQTVFGVCGEHPCSHEKRGAATAGKWGNHFFYGKCILDATGDGDLAVFAGAESVYGSRRDCITFWGSLAQYTSPNTYKNNFASMLVCADPADYTRFIRLGRKRGGKVFDHGTYVSMRESRHIKGTSSLDLRDWLMFREHEDGVYTCYSNYDPKGKLDGDIIYHGILPQQGAALVPLGTMCPVRKDGSRIQNMYVLGKAMDVTHNVFPGLRMQPDLMQQGAVMGMLAAKALSQGKSIEELSSRERREAVTEYTGDPLTLSVRRMTLEEAVGGLGEDTRTHWVDVDFTYEEKELNPWMVIYTANSKDAVPLLKERRLQEKSPLLRQRMSCALLWHGCEDGVAELIGEAEHMIAECGEYGLPVRQESVMCAQLLPDHGVMPELVYLLNVLSGSRSSEIVHIYEKVVSRLLSGERDYLDIRKGIFHYMESVALWAERSGLMESGPMLVRLLEVPELQGLEEPDRQTDLLTERLQILKLILSRALARLGGSQDFSNSKDNDKADRTDMGKWYDKLLECLEHGVLAVRYSACMELEDLLGVRSGLCGDQWRKEIGKNTPSGRVSVRRDKIW